jgi:predicted TIM-barrel fold metal-dependent hydrolase
MDAAPEPLVRRITNCHIHTFTSDHVPNRLLPLGLGPLLKVSLLRHPLRALLALVDPFDGRDRFQRAANVIDIASGTTQRAVLERVRRRYPSGTRFVVLAMDLAYMGAGRVPVPLEQQHEELAQLRDDVGDVVVPFAAVDPRRPGVAAMLAQLVEQRGFAGVKVYPNLGYAPTHPVLMEEVWPYAEARGLPVMTHCSRGGVRGREVSRAQLDDLAAPWCWEPVLERFPALRVCLAHMGGDEEWRAYFANDPEGTGREVPARPSWLAAILDLLRSGRFPSLYTDVSYTVFNVERYVPALKVFLADPRVGARVLFGSDYYMVEQERFEERLLALRLRGTLGEALFWQVAEENPARWLEG